MTTTYDPAVYWVLLLQLVIGFLSWAQLIFSMNRYAGLRRRRRNDAWAFLLSLEGGVVRWVGSLAVRGESFGFQVGATLVGATLAWASFVVVFNDDFVLPARQQVGALAVSLGVTALWEVNNRIVFEM